MMAIFLSTVAELQNNIYHLFQQPKLLFIVREY